MTPIDARKYLVSLLQNFAKNETSVQGGGRRPHKFLVVGTIAPVELANRQSWISGSIRVDPCK